ncbi:MAG: chromate transporter [Paludibacteraceae bacterium]|nr:chromate transporter [Paludibacteraceae bacterium]
MTWIWLFLSFFKIGLFGFGGGYAILSLIQHETAHYGWLSPQEFTDMVAVSQMTPGPIGINAATYVGYTATGSVAGAALATFALILPSLIIMYVLCRLYFRLKENRYAEGVMRGLRYVVVGLIAAAALVLMTPDNFIDAWSWLLFAAVFAGTLFFRLHPILLICLSGAAGWLIYGL